LQQVADHLRHLGTTDDCVPGVTADMVGKWERGEKKPSPFYREKLCRLYETSADQLGLLEAGVREAATLDRRQVLQLGAGLFLHGVTLPYSEHPSIEERVQLSQTLGESIAASWRLFQTASTTSVLAIAQAQLALLQYTHHLLLPDLRAMYYSAVYRLIGAALHFQGRYEEAHLAHEKTYLIALENGDAWNMAQSLDWQAYGFIVQHRYPAAKEAIEGALRLLPAQQNPETIRLQARLLVSGAEIAAYMGDVNDVQAKLHCAEDLLKDLSPHKECDLANWHHHAGSCQLILGQYNQAIKHLQKALDELSAHSQWTLHYATVLIPLALAYARQQDKEASLAIAEKTTLVLNSTDSPGLKRQFIEYIQQEFLQAFPTDQSIQTFVTDTQQQLLSASANSHQP
jgi:tetratricopeptide (TPR) repeat protein